MNGPELTPAQIPGAPLDNAVDLRAKSTIVTPGQSGETIQTAGGSNLPADFQIALDTAKVFLDPEQYIALLNSFKPWRRRLRMKQVTFGIDPIELLPVDETRTYFMYVNTSGTNVTFMGFDIQPIVGGGLPIGINNGSYEPLVVPTNQIFVVGAGAGTTGIALYAN